MSRWLGVFALGLLLVALSDSAAGPHPYHDDGGLIQWRSSVAVALKEADKTFRPLLIEICKETDKNAIKLAATAFKDTRLAQIINRYTVPVVVDSKLANSDPTIKALMTRAGKTEPYILILGEKAQYLEGLSGLKKPNEIEGAILNILMEKFAMSEATEKKIDEQLTELNQHIDAKDWAKAIPLYKAIVSARGYSAKKDTAYDLMDQAQADINLKYRDVLNHVANREFADARTILSEIIKNKEMAPLPLAGEAKDYLAALKLMEEANKYLQDAKTITAKAQGVQKLDKLLQLYADTPFANLALQQRREVMKEFAPKKK